MKKKADKLIPVSGFHLAVSAIIFIFSYSFLSASEKQSSDSSRYKRDLTLIGFYQYGSILQTNQFINGNNINQKPIKEYRSASLQLSVQTHGEKLWEQLYNFPRYGFGLYKPFFPDAPYLGDPLAVYGTIGFALKRWESISIDFDLGLGLAFNWKSYLEDKYNLAMGASESVIFSTTFSVEKKLVNGLILSAGAGFVHFSNGSLKVPNLGINVFTPKAGLGYNFARPEQKNRYQLVPVYHKQSEVYISAFTGWRNYLYDGSDVDSITQRKGVYYSCYGISAAYNYQVSHKSKFGVGVMADYLGFVNSSITTENGKLVPHPASFSNGFELSIYPSYELVLERASLVLQPGFYIYRTDYPERTPFIYQRIGLKYRITDDVSLGLYMRAHDWSIADFIEWTIGYRFR